MCIKNMSLKSCLIFCMDRRRPPRTVVLPESWLGVVETDRPTGGPSRQQTLLRGSGLILYAHDHNLMEYGSVLELKTRYASTTNICENVANEDECAKSGDKLMTTTSPCHNLPP